MILLTAVFAGLLITLLRAKLTDRQLRPIQLKHSWLVFAAVLPQVIVFQISTVGRQIPDTLASIILISSQAMLLVFAALNITRPGIWVFGTGLAANFVAIISNGGWMPIGPDTGRQILPSLPDHAPLAGQRLGLTKDWIIESSEIKFPWLADRFTLPDWISYKVAFSIGDVLIAIGAVLLLWSLSNPDNRS